MQRSDNNTGLLRARQLYVIEVHNRQENTMPSSLLISSLPRSPPTSSDSNSPAIFSTHCTSSALAQGASGHLAAGIADRVIWRRGIQVSVSGIR